jgi:hypothetical protein
VALEERTNQLSEQQDSDQQLGRRAAHEGRRWRRVARRTKATGTHRLGVVAGLWVVGLLSAAVLIHLADEAMDEIWGTLGWTRTPLVEPAEELATVAQVVPAVVVAIFVFAVGTQFVVAQVVPQARGTRAVEVLRERHLHWTLSPALALTPLSALVLVLTPQLAWPLAAALLIGAAAYLLISTWFLLGILGEATDPSRFADLLAELQSQAILQMRTEPGVGQSEVEALHAPVAAEHVSAQSRAPNGESVQGSNAAAGNDPGRSKPGDQPRDARTHRGDQRHQAAVDDLYDLVRTLRGWARSSATAGDSRELQVSLEGMLNLVQDYAYVPIEARKKVPDEYNRSALAWKTSPLREEAKGERPYKRDWEPWVFWVPPACPHEPDAEATLKWKQSKGFEKPPDEPAKDEDSRDLRAALARIWVANEVGRSLVRAVEFATTTKTLLDRDRARLLLTLAKASRRFADRHDHGSAGVMIAYLVELGLGARSCSPDELDWHFEPLARLVGLHKHFRKEAKLKADQLETDQAAGKPVDPVVVAAACELAMGAAAAVIAVAEAIAEARLGEHYGRQSGSAWDGEVDVYDTSVITIVERVVADLRSVPDVGEGYCQGRPPSGQQAGGKPQTALNLADLALLEPRGLAAIRPTNSKLLGLVAEVLSCKAAQWKRTNREAWTIRDSTQSTPPTLDDWT